MELARSVLIPYDLEIGLVGEQENQSVVQYRSQAKKSLPDVPAIVELVDEESSRQALALLGSASAIGYSFAAPPGLSPEVERALDDAFSQTMKDLAFLAAAARRKLDIQPLSGSEVQKIVAEAVATPATVVEIAKRATAKPN